MARNRKIALVGKMGSGKDYVADLLRKEFGFTRYAFGDDIRNIASRIFEDELVNPESRRKIMQDVGQKMREIDNDVWIRSTFRRISTNEDEQSKIVITDVRQPNEFERCQAMGYVMVRVDASDETRINRIQQRDGFVDHERLNHETEMHVDEFICDYAIDNDEDGANIMAQIAKVYYRG